MNLGFKGVIIVKKSVTNIERKCLLQFTESFLTLFAVNGLVFKSFNTLKNNLR